MDTTLRDMFQKQTKDNVWHFRQLYFSALRLGYTFWMERCNINVAI